MALRLQGRKRKRHQCAGNKVAWYATRIRPAWLESQLFSLLATEEPLLEFGWTPFFPIEAEYGEAISIRVVNRAGEIERFHNTADFRQCCGSRLEELTACTVQLPDPLLKRSSLRFLMLNNTSFQMLNERAAGCTGCVIVIAADAGGFSEDYQTLCDWLADERCAADRVSLILTQRAPRLNPALEMMAETMLKREKIAVFRCRTPSCQSPGSCGTGYSGPQWCRQR